MFRIAPSILCADFACLGDEVKNVLAAGADLVSFHPDARAHVDRTLQLIQGAGCQAGLAFNPAWPLDGLEHVFDRVDLIQIMSVNPGFGGQGFIDSALRTIERALKPIEATGRDIRLEVDGGIKVDHIRRVADAGADTCVAGCAIFSQPDDAQVIAAMRSQLNGVGTEARATVAEAA